MCFRFNKKKAIKVTNNKYFLGEQVNFKYRGEIRPGFIYSMKQDELGKVIYQIQIGGECPAIINDVQEEDIVYVRKRC